MALLLLWNNGKGYTIEYLPGACWEQDGGTVLVCESQIA
jgi:hypothetical protein